ncbi:hypothetical protein N7539_003091 [Penicillium diatomitis]|uniref:Uncharacterized protein n=1 Tax=Penicillium diatomitis TaxID=2819901 RepID=A0A9W9XG12_9EURO|nr:uncharacterized protein N7539_003091 [Penicillium diatomitis]KAJ5491524.1 hypothetical protein N7539_003091 [Penicillium diatomitis]
MSSFSGDKVLWLCLGVSLFFAVRGIVHDLRRVVELTEIKHVEKEDKIISDGAEDVLKLDTLLTLSQSTSHELRSAALRIISERATKGPARDLLLEDLSSKNKDRRDKALTALHFLTSNRALSRASVCANLQDLETFTALINCLCNFLDEHTEETSSTVSPILPKTRPMGEKKALLILNVLLPEDIPEALSAGIVSRWLVKYPFPCALDESSGRDNVILLMKNWWSDDATMSSILGTLTTHPEGYEQLQEYGLMSIMGDESDEERYRRRDEQDARELAAAIQDLDDDDDSAIWDFDEDSDEDAEEDMPRDGDILMEEGEDTAGLGSRAPSRRLHEGTTEDQALRRRRREAMVLSEGGRPLGRENIIQPPL